MDTNISVSKAQALDLYGGNQAALARALGVSRQYISRLDDGDLPEWMALKLRFVLKPEGIGPSPARRPTAAKGEAAEAAQAVLNKRKAA